MNHDQNVHPYQIINLPDKLRIIHIPLTTTASVTMQIYFGAGSRYEEPEIAGVSHFLEHMAFKATKKRPSAKEISLAIEGMGGLLNAWTSEEATAYWCKLPAIHFQKGFEVLSDMVMNPTLPEDEIKREAQVILEEMAREEDNPDQRVFEVFSELMFPNQALGRRIIGSRETILAINQAILRDYIDSLYGPQNAVVSIAGPIDQVEVKETVERYLKLPKRQIRRHWEPIKRMSNQSVSVYKKDTEQIHTILGVQTFPRDDERTPVLSVLNTLLGYGMSSRLFLNVREKKGLAYSVGSATDYFHDTGVWFCYSGIKREKIKPAIVAIMAELTDIKQELVPEREIFEAKEKVRGRFVLGLETSNALADYYGKQVLLDNKVETPQEWLARIDTVTAAQVQQLANELFKPEALKLAMIGPNQPEAEFTTLLTH